MKIILSLFFILGLFITTAQADTDHAKNTRLRKELILVPEVVLPSRSIIPSFGRPASRIGYTWIEGTFDEYNRYHPGYWKPLNPEIRYGGQMVWAPGYNSSSGWVYGYWRKPERPGFTWIQGYYDDQADWHQGRWEQISLYPPEKSPHPPHSRQWNAWQP